MSSRPDVALVSLYPRGEAKDGAASGVASYSANLLSALKEQGADVRSVPARERSVCGDDQPSFARGPLAGPAALRAALSTGAPVLHLQLELFLYGRSSLPGMLAALAAAKRARRATVVTAHQVVDVKGIDASFAQMHGIPLPAPLARRALGSLQQLIGRLPDAVVVHERAQKRELPGAVVIPHGIETAKKGSGALARARLGLSQDRLAVLCFGFIAPYKGLELACEAARLAGSGVSLLIAGGEHPRHAAGYAGELRRRYGDCASFTGHVAEQDLPELFAACDLALLPYPRPHASSGALALALAHEVPVLLSQALADLVGAPALGCDIDPPQLARRLQVLASDRSRLQELGAQSAMLAGGRSWSQVAARHIELYEEVRDANASARGRSARI